MNIDMNHKYQTRDGRAVRILAIDTKGADGTILGLVTYGEGREYAQCWKADGRSLAMGVTESSMDLVLVPTRHNGWAAVSVSRGWIGPVYASLEDARADAERQTREHDAPPYYVTRVYEES